MRLLFASTKGAGHFNPLVPFIEAALRGGHDVLVAGPDALASTLEPTGYPFWNCADPLEEDIRPVWEQAYAGTPEEANELVVREIFARFDARALLPRLREAFDAWKPDLVMREPNEYASAVAADLYGVPVARVAIGLAAVEEGGLEIAAATVGELRREVGLPDDPEGDQIRSSPYVTLFPASLEDPEAAVPPSVLRARDPDGEPPRSLPEWWPGREGPLVYVTFGSVTASIPNAASTRWRSWPSPISRPASC